MEKRKIPVLNNEGSRYRYPRSSKRTSKVDEKLTSDRILSEIKFCTVKDTSSTSKVPSGEIPLITLVDSPTHVSSEKAINPPGETPPQQASSPAESPKLAAHPAKKSTNLHACSDNSSELTVHSGGVPKLTAKLLDNILTAALCSKSSTSKVPSTLKCSRFFEEVSEDDTSEDSVEIISDCDLDSSDDTVQVKVVDADGEVEHFLQTEYQVSFRKYCIKYLQYRDFFFHPKIYIVAEEPTTVSCINLQKVSDSEDMEAINTEENSSSNEEFNPEFCPGKVKIQDEIDNIKQPVIGLSYIVEIWDKNKTTVKNYRCFLCKEALKDTTVVSHITRRPHGALYMKTHFPVLKEFFPQETEPHLWDDEAKKSYDELCEKIEQALGRQQLFITSYNFYLKNMKNIPDILYNHQMKKINPGGPEETNTPSDNNENTEWFALQEQNKNSVKEEKSAEKQETRQGKVQLDLYQGKSQIENVIKAFREKSILGLNYLLEMWDNKMFSVRNYRCFLCSDSLRQSAVLQHVSGVNHKKRFMEKHFLGFSDFPKKPLSQWDSFNQKDFEVRCARIETICGRQEIFITTIGYYLKNQKLVQSKVESSFKNTPKGVQLSKIPARSSSVHSGAIPVIENKGNPATGSAKRDGATRNLIQINTGNARDKATSDWCESSGTPPMNAEHVPQQFSEVHNTSFNSGPPDVELPGCPLPKRISTYDAMNFLPPSNAIDQFGRTYVASAEQETATIVNITRDALQKGPLLPVSEPHMFANSFHGGMYLPPPPPGHVTSEYKVPGEPSIVQRPVIEHPDIVKQRDMYRTVAMSGDSMGNAGQISGLTITTKNSRIEKQEIEHPRSKRGNSPKKGARHEKNSNSAAREKNSVSSQRSKEQRPAHQQNNDSRKKTSSRGASTSDAHHKSSVRSRSRSPPGRNNAASPTDRKFSRSLTDRNRPGSRTAVPQSRFTNRDHRSRSPIRDGYSRRSRSRSPACRGLTKPAASRGRSRSSERRIRSRSPVNRSRRAERSPKRRSQSRSKSRDKGRKRSPRHSLENKKTGLPERYRTIRRSTSSSSRSSRNSSRRKSHKDDSSSRSHSHDSGSKKPCRHKSRAGKNVKKGEHSRKRKRRGNSSSSSSSSSSRSSYSESSSSSGHRSDSPSGHSEKGHRRERSARHSSPSRVSQPLPAPNEAIQNIAALLQLLTNTKNNTNLEQNILPDQMNQTQQMSEIPIQPSGRYDPREKFISDPSKDWECDLDYPDSSSRDQYQTGSHYAHTRQPEGAPFRYARPVSDSNSQHCRFQENLDSSVLTNKTGTEHEGSILSSRIENDASVREVPEISSEHLFDNFRKTVSLLFGPASRTSDNTSSELVNSEEKKNVMSPKLNTSSDDDLYVIPPVKPNKSELQEESEKDEDSPVVPYKWDPDYLEPDPGAKEQSEVTEDKSKLDNFLRQQNLPKVTSENKSVLNKLLTNPSLPVKESVHSLGSNENRKLREAARKPSKLGTLYHHLAQNPEIYKREWQKFYVSRAAALMRSGKKISDHDFNSEWIRYINTCSVQDHFANAKEDAGFCGSRPASEFFQISEYEQRQKLQGNHSYGKVNAREDRFSSDPGSIRNFPSNPDVTSLRYHKNQMPSSTVGNLGFKPSSDISKSLDSPGSSTSISGAGSSTSTGGATTSLQTSTSHANPNAVTLAQRLASVLTKLGMSDVPHTVLSEMIGKLRAFSQSVSQDVSEHQIISILRSCGYLK